MTDNNKPTCSICRFFHPTKKTVLVLGRGEVTQGQCRRHAPTWTPASNDTRVECWPIVTEIMWCGEHGVQP